VDISVVAVVIATIAGPVLAVQTQKIIERIIERSKRKEFIFRTLMATRAARVSTEHVQALNMIDFEFYGGGDKEKSVREAWVEYRDHMNLQHTPETFPVWEAKWDELFVDLLLQMSVCSGFTFSRADIRKSAYSPVAHGNLENDQSIIRTGLVALFSKKFAIPVLTMPATNDEAKEQSALRQMLFENLSGQRPYKVEIVNGSAVADTNAVETLATKAVEAGKTGV
jgi:hypothetical protein